MELTKNDIIDFSVVCDLLDDAGYRYMNVVEQSGDYALRRVEDVHILDIFLAENQTTAIRCTVADDGTILDIVPFNAQNGQLHLPIESTIISNVVQQVRGNVIYHVGLTQAKRHFVLLRGAGVKDRAVKSAIKQAGFVWHERWGQRRLMAWRAEIHPSALVPLLVKVRDMGFNVQASDKTSAKFRIRLPYTSSSKNTTSSAPNPFTVARNAC